MKEKVLKLITASSVISMIIVIIFTFIVTGGNKGAIYVSNIKIPNPLYIIKKKEHFKYSEIFISKELQMSKEIKKVNLLTSNLSESYIKIKKPKSNIMINSQDLYMDKKIRIEIYGLNEVKIEKNAIEFINQLDIDNPLDKRNDIDTKTINAIYLERIHDPITMVYTTIIDIELDKIYEHEIYIDNDYFYISLLDPRENNEKIIVVDPGHGGIDGGTQSLNTIYNEKDINLDIVLELKSLLDKSDIKVYYSRLTDERVPLESRVKLANDIKADFFISVHCNANIETKPNGTEVLYNELSSNRPINSKELAKICLDELVKVTNAKKRGLVEGNNILIIGNSKVPVALIEVAYMSNEKDLEFIINDENKKLVALGIYNGIISAYKILDDNNDKE